MDLTGMVREVNQSVSRLLACPSSSLIGHPLLMFVTEAHRSEFLEHMRRVRYHDDVAEADLDLMARNDRIVPVHLSTRRSPRHDQALCWTIIVDVTERQRLEEARRRADRDRDRAEHDEVVARTRNEAKDRFIATLSHELRNPLTPALYAASYLAELAELPRPALRYVEMIRRNVEFEARLIDDLLDVTRIDQGKFSLQLGVVDVNAVLTECVAAGRMPAEAKALTLASDLRATTTTVCADQTRLRQVIWNLLSNAVKFTPPGGRIVVSTFNDQEGAIRLSVMDTGIGIDPSRLSSLFVPFEQIGRRDQGGLGLGLAISRGIIEAHHGRLWGSSLGLGQGATFEVELATVDDRPTALASPRPAIEGHAIAARRILIVEDHEDSAEMLRLVLQTAGHSVEVASTLQAALARLDEDWDLIVSDLGLPDGSGLDLARQARASTHRPARMVAVSGYGSAADRHASALAGFDEHLTKPVLPKRILELLP